ncbi:MAG: hypothetical protein SFZ24_06205 [Planctomycetota bacterium]|nr:hypothetical protein [Planctomycetota bacterium]
MSDRSNSTGATLVAAGASLILGVGLGIGAFYCGWGLWSVVDTYGQSTPRLRRRGLSGMGPAILTIITLLLGAGSLVFIGIAVKCAWDGVRNAGKKPEEEEEDLVRAWKDFPAPKD